MLAFSRIYNSENTEAVQELNVEIEDIKEGLHLEGSLSLK